MVLIKIKLAVFLAAFYFGSAVYAIELQKGTTQVFGMSFTDQQSQALSKVTNIVRANNDTERPLLSLAFANPNGSQWFRLYENMMLYGVDVENEKLLGSWPLTRWPEEYLEPELLEDYTLANASFSGLSGPGSWLGDRLGCLPQTPLRYGDIEQDGHSELVLFIGFDMLIFSPESGGVVFGQTLGLDEWLSEENTRRYAEVSGGLVENSPWFQSALEAGRSGTSRGNQYPGLRGYSKFYIGDYDENGATDILVWRKLYRSRLRDQPKGFDQVANTLLHYEHTEQGYVRRDDDGEAARVRSWLAANNLTWQSGFPSKSECPGSEGELIPEMHDPLLNDPEVLQ